MNQDREEEDFEAYLEGKSSLSADYQAAAVDEPPAAIDDSILAASRRELKTGPAYVSGPFASSWQVPVSLAAVLVLSVSVFVNIQEDHDSSYLDPPQTSRHDALEETAQSDSDVEARAEVNQLAGSRKEIPATMSASSAAEAALAGNELMMDDMHDELVNEIPMVMEQQAEKYQDVEEAGLFNTPARVQREMDSDFASIAPAAKPGSAEFEAKRNAREAADTKMRRLEFPSAMKQDFGKREPGRELFSRQERESDIENEDSTSATIMAADSGLTPLAWLARIQGHWDEGNVEMAKRELGLFKESYPDFKLEGQLHQELLQTLNGHVSP